MLIKAAVVAGALVLCGFVLAFAFWFKAQTKEENEELNKFTREW